MLNSADHREEGQTILALLLVMVVLLGLGLMFAQVGSAADQRTQTQTAADAGAVAAAHEVRDWAVAEAAAHLSEQFPTLAGYAAGIAARSTDPAGTACDAAVENWNLNPHHTALDCRQLAASESGGRVLVDLTAPAGEIANRPIDTSASRSSAHAEARLAVRDCPGPLATPAARVVAAWLVDRAAGQVQAAGPRCVSPTDLAALLREQPTAEALGVPAVTLLAAVSGSFRAELVD